MKFETLLIHGVTEDKGTGAVNVPIYQTSTYKQAGIGDNKGYEYSRSKNPTREALETQIAKMEEGLRGFAFASGMAAISAVLMLFKSGDRILLSEDIYGGTFRVIDQVFSRFNLKYDVFDPGDPESLQQKIDPDVKAVLIESPTNPTMVITDIAAVAKIAGDNGIITIVDNTFMTPYLQKPLLLGADIVIHSATKYLGGHSDLIAGLAVVNKEELGDRLYFIQKSTGGILGPVDSFQVLKGIKTLAVRMDRHLENAARVAGYLRDSNAVDKIYYPGFPEHPGHGIQKKQAEGFGAVIAFTLKPGYDIDKFVRGLQIIALGESLGGVESLMTHPATMSHGSMPRELRQRLGITDGLVRLSVGIESAQDLIDDLQHALECASIH